MAAEIWPPTAAISGFGLIACVCVCVRAIPSSSICVTQQFLKPADHFVVVVALD